MVENNRSKLNFNMLEIVMFKNQIASVDFSLRRKFIERVSVLRIPAA